MHAWTTSDHRTYSIPGKSISNLSNKPKNAALNEWSENVNQKKQMDGIFEEFVESTTLPGVTQVCKRKKLEWKIFWFFVSLGATMMSIYQSWPILKDFIDGKTVQSTSYSPDYDFPSVTICSNIRLTKTKKENFFNDLDLPENSGKDYFFTILKREFSGNYTSVGERFKPRSCSFNKKPCNSSDVNDYYYFRTANFGPCLTFNMGTHFMKRGRPNNVLNFKLSTERHSRSYDWNENYIQIWVHPPGTAPVLYRSEGFRVYPGDILEIRFDMKHITRLPKRRNECLDPLTTEQRFNNIYYTNHTNYIYSTKACVYSLLFDAKLENYGCLDSGVPMNHKWIGLWKTQQYNICEPGMTFPNSTTESNNKANNDESHENDFNTLYNFDANCSLPCTEWMVDYTVISTSAWFESLVSSTLQATQNKTKPSKKISWDSNSVDIKLSLASTMVEMVDEDYRYKTGDFAGIIGGNVGLWIGLCVISLAEAVELGIRLVSLILKRLFYGKGWRKPTVKIIQIKRPYQ
ncbi:hypothetical protein CHUAL_009898 [Chamberlinius hualienensis]